MALYINGNKTGGGGGNADIVHLTQAEYDALPPTKLTDNKVYMITDTNGDGSQFQPVIYSEDEREIGVWTDGKPLYEKVFIASSPISISGSAWIATSFIINSENIVSATLIDPNGNTSGELPVANINGYINIYPSFSANVKTIILQYTKTTDTAGSGTWTPQGVPAVHYSTDEQVVGTWVDGNTLYEKTIIASISEVNSHEYSDNDLSNSDMAMIIDGYYTLTDNFIKVPLNQWESSTYYTRAGFRNDKTIYLYANGYSVTGNAYITVRYTKTSQGGN